MKSEIMNENAPREAHLWNTKGGSDKVYDVYLRSNNGSWSVDFAYGRRGSTLATGSKTENGVGYLEATKVFDQLVNSKIKGGYVIQSTGPTSTAYTTGAAGRDTGLDLQLLTPIDEETCERLLADDAWGAQLKANGERRALIISNGQVTGANRKGLAVDVPQNWQDEYGGLGDMELDGEQIGGIFYAFDLLSMGDKDIRNLSFASRYLRLSTMFYGWSSPPASFRLLEAQASTSTKTELLRDVREKNLEGIVFKLLSAPYEAGRSNYALKFKLVDQVTCIVMSKNRQRSVVIGLVDASGTMKPFGNVTIPSNHEVPDQNDLIEVQFLYFTGQAFEQPVYLGKRADLDVADANTDQIKRIKPVIVQELEPA